MTADTAVEKTWLTVGQLASDSGVAPSAVRFYDAHGLIFGQRTAGNQRRFHRVESCIVKIVRVAQRAGLSVAEIRELLTELPCDRAEIQVDDFLRLRRALESEARQRIRALNEVLDDLAAEPKLCEVSPASNA